jgi:enoyl-CoA hydratase/carnithine racemase
MDYQEIRYGPAEGAGPQVVQVTLDRPAALNAYTSRMCEELGDALLRYARDEDARVLVLTGAGRAFCAGGDVASQVEVEEAARRQLGHAVVMRERMHLLAQALYRMDKPLIAMINGPAVAGGLTLALLCDLRIAAASARLGDTSGRAGLLPDEGGAWLFPRIMGIAAATRMTLLAELYDAPAAQQLGLVSEVVPDERLRERTMQLADELAARAPLAVRVAKRMMRRSLELTFEQSLGDAEFAVSIVNDSADVQEGVAAFLDKRAPVFRGR